MQLNIDDLDFDHCQDEPIHIPESIQSYGYLFAINAASGTISIVSENIQELLTDEKGALGQNFYNYLKDEDNIELLKETCKRASKRNTRLPVKLDFKEDKIKTNHSSDFYAVVYNSDEYIVVELEPVGQFRELYSARHFIKMYAASVAPKFKDYESLDSMAKEIVETIKYITDFDRVVLYKFNADGTGKVIAESKEEDMVSYLNLLYPASDIPPQARELYKKNWVRLTPNTDLVTSKLIPGIEEGSRKPLDMTHSVLRSLSPIHLQYIRNQGLRASMSLSLVTHDKLWGIISCHSRTEKYIPQNVRMECENLSQLFSWHLYAKEEELSIIKKQETELAIDKMLEKSPGPASIVKIFKDNEEEILEITGNDGFMFYSETQQVSLGLVPDFSIVKSLNDQMSGKGKNIFVTSRAAEQVDNVERLNGIRGILLIPLIENKSYFTAWFRKEAEQVERWAGHPDEKLASSSKKERLTPRSSFQVHERRILNESNAWTAIDIETANRFNRVFMAYVLESHDQMRKSISKLELQSQYKNEFLATLAHELRNPLTPLTVGISMLEDTADEALRERIVDTMRRQVKHMTTLVDDLMDVSRITQGKVKLDTKDVSINRVVYHAVETCQRLIDEKNHNLLIDMPERTVMVHGDATRLSQIFVNILNNAAKYTNPNGRIIIEVIPNNDWVSIIIRDNGVGIPAENLDSIFTMFTQVDAHSAKTKGGLGIGLTLVQRLVTLHDGEIEVRSEGLDKGSEFEVRLPISHYEDSTETNEQKSEPGRAKSKKRILLVDDNEDVIHMYEMLLSAQGYEVKTSTNGYEAIKIFKDFIPDFALFDIGMPEIDGFELCRRLSATPEAAHTVFISQSGWGNKEKMQEAYDAGFKEHLIKPLDKAKLKEVLEKYS